MNKPRETILTVAHENRALRWLTLILAVAVSFCAAALYKRPPQPAWLVKEDGQILVDSKKVFNWQLAEVPKRALDAFFVASPDRQAKIDTYLTGDPLSKAKGYSPSDRFIDFRLQKESEVSNGFYVEGVLFRESKPEVTVSMTLSQVDKTLGNPFGLVVSSATLNIK